MKLGFKKFVSLSLIAIFTIVSSSYAFAGYHESNSEPSAQQLVDPSTHIVGLPNSGYQCYYNSAIQCLYLNSEFRNFVLNNEFNEEDQPVLFVLNDLFTSMNKLNKFNVLNYELYKSIIGDSGEFYSIPNDNPVTIPELKDEVPTDVFGYLPGKLNQALEKENFPVGFYYDKDKDFIENTFYVHTHGGKFRKLYSNLVSACEKESSFVKDIGLCVLDSYSKAKNFKHKLMPEGGIEDILEQSYSQVSVVIYTGSHFYVVFKNLYGNYYFLSDFNTCQISRDSFYSDINLTGFDSSEDCVLEYIVK